MITLITGLPGHGKTLYAIWYVKKYCEAENARLSGENSQVLREVFYSGIKDLTLPWTQIDPETWPTLQPGSIVVIDECQFVFPKKPNGATLPDFYSLLATHRHLGIDIFLITQHPSLLDNFVRKLTDRHFHAVRKFGLQRNTIYEWSPVCGSPETLANKKAAITLEWSYPKEVFSYYKSAELHTVKRRIPPKLLLAIAFVVAMPIAGYYALDRFQKRGAANATSVPVVAPPGQSTVATSPQYDPLADAKLYVRLTTPRVEGLPHTAPKYDELTKPVRVPVPAACIKIGSLTSEKGLRCKCFSQQGTPMSVKYDMCLEIAANGFFQEFDADPNRGVDERSRVSSERPAVQNVPPGGLSNVLVIPDLSAPARKISPSSKG